MHMGGAMSVELALRFVDEDLPKHGHKCKYLTRWSRVGYVHHSCLNWQFEF